MATTAHFFYGNTELKSFCLECTEFSERHTGDNLNEKLMKIVRNWNITHKVTSIVSDNAANVTNAIQKTRYHQVSCFAHTLNLAVQNGLKDISSVIQKLKSIVGYSKRSHHALAKLQATQEQMNMPKLKLIQDVATRWNSTYDMLQRFIKVKDAINSTLAVLQSNVEMLTPEEWIIVEKAAEVLEIFYEVTKEISGDRYVTLSVVLIFTGVIFESMNKYEQDITLPINLHTMVLTLKQQITSRLKPLEDNDLVTHAALLDLWYKKLTFTNISEQKYTNALNKLRQKVCSVEIEDTHTQRTTKKPDLNLVKYLKYSF